VPGKRRGDLLGAQPRPGPRRSRCPAVQHVQVCARRLANRAGPDGRGAFPSVATTIRYTGQGHRSQELGEVAGLVVLDADLEVVQEVAAVLGDAERVHPVPSARQARRRSCRPRPVRLTGRGPAPWPGGRRAGHGNRARWPLAARDAGGCAGLARAGPGRAPARRGGPARPRSFSHPAPGTGRRSGPAARAAAIRSRRSVTVSG
jgi:hypothetical protein